ncbi:MAG: hypothetical protein ABR572_04380 [Cryomorphaceae bacterium]|nr:hypothetical protein [Flavobacteriales bacterium]
MKTSAFVAIFICAVALLSSCSALVKTKNHYCLESIHGGNTVEANHEAKDYCSETGYASNGMVNQPRVYAITCSNDDAVPYDWRETKIHGGELTAVGLAKSNNTHTGGAARMGYEVSSASKVNVLPNTGSSKAMRDVGRGFQPLGDSQTEDDYYSKYADSSEESPWVLFSAGIAYSRRLTGRSAGFSIGPQNFHTDPRNGYAFGADIGLRIFDRLYLGPRFDRFMSSRSAQISIYTVSNGTFTGDIKEDVGINFFALQLAYVMNIRGGRSSLTMACATGYMHYNMSGIAAFYRNGNRPEFLPFSYTGGNIGIRLSGGYDIRWSSDTKLTLGFGVASATVMELEENIDGVKNTRNLKYDDLESLLRLDLGAAFTYFF